MNCANCGAEVRHSNAYCPTCGTRLRPGDPAGEVTTPLSQPSGPERTSLPPSPGRALQGRKDPTLAFLLEVVLGLFGFLGVGHMYAGAIIRGAVLLIGWWIVLAVAIVAILVLGIFTLGLGFCLFPLLLLAYLAGPVASAFWVRSDLEREPYGLSG